MAESSQDKLWTPANIVTMVRICFVPLFVVIFLAPWPEWLSLQNGEAWRPWLSALVFVLISGTDAVDGYLARSRNEVTNFGKFMDPLADKILVCAALLALTELGVLPSWVTLIILTREFIVSGMRMIAASNGTVIAASWYGKAKTVTQMLAIVLFILWDAVRLDGVSGVLGTPLLALAWLVMVVALVLTVLSMVDYLVKSKELLGFGASKKGEDSSPAQACGLLDTLGDSNEGHAAQASEVQLRLIDADELIALAERVVAACEQKGLTLGCAESLTGGMICSTLTAVPGSSRVVRGSVVSYVNQVKQQALGVSKETLDAEGAVSAQTSQEMAQGARAALDCSIAVAVTGIAGPTGAEEGKPVGTVWLSVADANGVASTRVQLPGDRDEVRRFTVRAALELLEKELKQ